MGAGREAILGSWNSSRKLQENVGGHVLQTSECREEAFELPNQIHSFSEILWSHYRGFEFDSENYFLKEKMPNIDCFPFDEPLA